MYDHDVRSCPAKKGWKGERPCACFWARKAMSHSCECVEDAWQFSVVSRNMLEYVRQHYVKAQPTLRAEQEAYTEWWQKGPGKNMIKPQDWDVRMAHRIRYIQWTYPPLNLPKIRYPLKAWYDGPHFYEWRADLEGYELEGYDGVFHDLTHF